MHTTISGMNILRSHFQIQFETDLRQCTWGRTRIWYNYFLDTHDPIWLFHLDMKEGGVRNSGFLYHSKMPSQTLNSRETTVWESLVWVSGEHRHWCLGSDAWSWEQPHKGSRPGIAHIAASTRHDDSYKSQGELRCPSCGYEEQDGCSPRTIHRTADRDRACGWRWAFPAWAPPRPPPRRHAPRCPAVFLKLGGARVARLVQGWPEL